MLDLKSKIRTIPNWPKKGIMFRDITTLIQDPEGLKESCKQIYEKIKDKEIDVIAGIESRGFIFGSIIATMMNKGLIIIRKPGKLPHKTISEEYELEYGVNKIEMHIDAIKKDAKILIVDDLLATGGTMKAACNLIEKAGGIVAGCAFVIELPELKGIEKLKNYDITKLITFSGE